MNIAVFTGGESSEREVAFWSAKNVVAELERVGFDVVIFDVPSELPKFLESREQFSCVVPVLHGAGGEDGTIQGFLKTLKMPFIFSDVAAHAVAMDKALAKAIVSSRGLRTPNARVISRGETCIFEKPVVVKPLSGGSTIGTTIVRHKDELASALDLGFEQGDNLLVEDFIEGDEFTIAVIEEDGQAIALDVIGIVPIVEGGFYDFEAKYGSTTPAKHLLPAPISLELKRELQRQAAMAHAALGVRHVSRSDFFVDRAGEIWFIETNTIPGCTNASLLPESIRHSGRDFGELLKQWIESVL